MHELALERAWETRNTKSQQQVSSITQTNAKKMTHQHIDLGLSSLSTHQLRILVTINTLIWYFDYYQHINWTFWSLSTH